MIDFSITQNSVEQKPIAFKYVPRKGQFRMLSKEFDDSEILEAVENVPGCGGIYPCYSLVEDTETI